PHLAPASISHRAAPAEVHTLSLHDALPIYRDDAAARARAQPAQRSAEGREEEKEKRRVGSVGGAGRRPRLGASHRGLRQRRRRGDRKSTRLNSSHVKISYAVFCLKKKTRSA